MTVYTDNPFGGFGGGMRNFRMPRPPINQPQIPPMNQMPRRMPGGPSKVELDCPVMAEEAEAVLCPEGRERVEVRCNNPCLNLILVK
jgi:hypothetical protein